MLVPDGRDKSSFGFIESFWSTLKLTLQLYSGYYPFQWALSGALLEAFGVEAKEHELLHTAAFFLQDTLFETLLSLPFSLYRTFVIEERHGFNKQTLGLFISDTLKSLMLNAIIAPPLLSLFIVTIEWGGQHFYLYVSALMLIVQLVAIPVYSNFIQPLFNKVEPVPQGELRTQVEVLAARLDFPLTELYEIDGSKRSSHSNAYFYGFWKSKRIVLFDTLLKQCSLPQVLAVLGHELGHWKLNHTVKNLVAAQINFLGMFWLAGHLIHEPRLYHDFGFHHTQATYIGLLLFSFVFSPLSHLIQFAQHVLSRRFEFQADAFAVELGYGDQLGEALITLQKENKSTMISDPLYSAYHHSHPPLLQRLQAIEQEKSKSGKKVQ